MSEDTLHVLMSGIALGESPRWHDGRLWFCDWVAQCATYRSTWTRSLPAADTCRRYPGVRTIQGIPDRPLPSPPSLACQRMLGRGHPGGWRPGRDPETIPAFDGRFDPDVDVRSQVLLQHSVEGYEHGNVAVVLHLGDDLSIIEPLVVRMKFFDSFINPGLSARVW